MTCKDCLHYELCRYNTYQEAHYFGKAKEIYITIDNNSPCKYFTNRSEWIHLPCKVGDKIYQTDGIRTYESTIRTIEISSARTVYFTDNIAFDKRAIGNSIFLTREEAEKALEGMK